MEPFFARAYAAHRDGRLADAERDYRAAIDADPVHTDALHLLGVLRHQQGRHEEAADLVGRAVALRPNDAALQLNLGNALKALGRLDGAIDRFRNALSLAPEFPLAHYNLANTYALVGRHQDAVDAFERSLRLQPNDASTYNNLGNALHALGRSEEAIAAFSRALALRPGHAGAHNNLGMAFAALGRTEDALAQFRAALAAQPNFVAAHFNLGNTLDAIGSHAQAAAAFEAALTLQGAFPPALLGLGNALAAQGRHADAIARFERAVGLDPQLALAWLGLGNAHHALGSHDAALRAFDQALRLRPDLASAQLNRALTLLTLGDLARGLPAYESRLAIAAAAEEERKAEEKTTSATLAPPRWRGEPIDDRTLLIEAEQGFGDTLQFLRFVPLARERAGRVVLTVQRELEPLVAPLAKDWRVTLAVAGETRPKADLHCPLLSLPLALGATLDALPAPRRYLDVPPAYRRRWRGSLGGHAKVKVGLAWSGRIQAQENRAMPVAALAPLLALEGIDWLVLQPNLSDDDKRALDALARTASLHRFDTRIADFADTAAIVDRLDAIVSIDTSIAHLAGALGKPLWLMLPFAADWRWFANTDRSPWYPSARLARQPSPGQWDAVVEEVARALSRELSGR
ncbi:tetratricopeptide repeat protein [Trinickia dinghuensis]|uniref:Tetratricopeptide repeat protein n=1 Tax=Trinickia dinghuensis TaxID=2291023 RepID=A0A3D8JXJ6_9BURK|nr:tetratricopeptide repeat protein [Trinickia dinghuensis]RDU97081.1 tetratricopeptide repeat protein [Trinickia dinghuensis]